LKKVNKLERSRTAELYADVFEFLHSVYCSIAETLPDVRDGAMDETEHDCKIELSQDDPYTGVVDSTVIQTGHGESAGSAKGKAKPRKMQRSMLIRPGRTPRDGVEERFLPPGTMKEYWHQYTQKSQLSPPASFPVFWRVPGILW